MSSYAGYLFATASNTPQGGGEGWRPDIVTMNGIGDAAIALSFFIIAFAMYRVLHRRRDIAYRWVIALSIAFILMCGLNHLISLLALWWPIQGTQGLVKFATGSVSVATALALWPLIPNALALTSPKQLLRKTNEELKLALSQVEALFESAPDATIIVDETGRIVRANKRTVDLFGYSLDDLRGLGVEQLMPERYRAQHVADRSRFSASPGLRQMGSGLDLFALSRDGKEFPIEVSLSPILYEDREVVCAAIRDVAVERRIRDQLGHAQRLDAIGKLTGGVAHDFNNLLSVILANLQLLQRMNRSNPELNEYVDACIKATRRGSELTSSLLAFARQQPLSPSDLLLCDLFRDVGPLLAKAVHPQIKLVVDDLPGDLAVRCDASQLQAVLLNLVANAGHAIRMKSRGRIAMSARGVEHDADTEALSSEAVAPGPYVEISISDNGEGMDAATLERALEPFFTTKPQGAGTGLGLAMVDGFVKQSKGFMSIQSELGVGTTVRVFLPRVQLSAQQELREAQDAEPDPLHEQTYRILVVDDDPQLRPAMMELLSDQGFDVVGAAGHDEAVQAFESQGPFDVALCDIFLGGQEDGLSLAKLLTNRDHRIRIILATGYSPLVREMPEALPGPVLIKPFDEQQLKGALRTVLNAETGRDDSQDKDPRIDRR